MKCILYLLASVLILSSCKKELSLEGAIPQQPLPEPKPEPEDTLPRYKLTAFYSDIPIDFDETDSVTKYETNLWSYVLEYIKDDYHILREDGTLEIIQNENKMPGLEDPVLYRTYSTGTDDSGEFIYYLTSEYEPAKYRLYEMNEDYYIIYLKWKDGAHVFSRFDRIK